MKSAMEAVAGNHAAAKSRSRQGGRTETAATDRGSPKASATHADPAATEAATMESAAKTSTAAMETSTAAMEATTATVKATAATKSATRRSRLRDQHGDRGEREQRDHCFA